MCDRLGKPEELACNNRVNRRSTAERGALEIRRLNGANTRRLILSGSTGQCGLFHGASCNALATAGNDRAKEISANASSRSMKAVCTSCVPILFHHNCTHLNVLGRVLARKIHALHSTSFSQQQCRIFAKSPCALCRAARH